MSKELYKQLDFSNGVLMRGFDYKGQQIVAMPFKEYDKLMKKDEALEILKLVLGLNATNRAIIRQAYETGWITEEQVDLLEEVLKK